MDVDECFASTGFSAQNQHSYSWYQNASESDRKPLAQTTTLKTSSKVESTTYDSWDAIMGLRPPSPSPEPWNPAPTPTLLSAGSCERGLARREKAPSPPHSQSPGKRPETRTDSDFVLEMTDFSQISSSSSSLDKNSNCRTYRRPTKQSLAPSKASDLAEPPSTHHTSQAGGRGRGRTRDYTVLHPSAVSVSNITIQSRGVDDFPADSSSSDSTAGLGSGTELGAGWQRKKADPQHGR